MGRIRTNRHAVAALLPVIAVGVAGCGGASHPAKTTSHTSSTTSHTSTTASRTVDRSRVAAAIAASVKSERHVDASVTCPTGVASRTAPRFYCVAQVGAQITTFAITRSGSSGQLSFTGVGASAVPHLDAGRIEQSIAASIKGSRGATAAVRCPVDFPRQRGLSFVCSATARSGATTRFEVRQLDSHGRVTYRGL
jgi:hypothetical protein